MYRPDMSVKDVFRRLSSQTSSSFFVNAASRPDPIIAVADTAFALSLGTLRHVYLNDGLLIRDTTYLLATASCAESEYRIYLGVNMLISAR